MNRFKGKKILIVDDDSAIRETLIDKLELYGAKCEEASDGLIAFDKIKSNFYDCIVSDIRMPNASGIELLKMIKDYDKKAPKFIMMSAFTDLTDDSARELGAYGLYLKPHDLDILLELIDDDF